MAMSRDEARFLVASRITTKRITPVANTLGTWLDSKPTLSTAIVALLAASGSSKSPDRLTAKANEFYAALENDPPTVASVSPSTGTTAGGTAVTITGTNLTAASAVTFGGTPATSVVVVSDTQITCVTPAKTAGAVTVQVTTPAGSGSKSNGFTYA